ncbi:MAG: AIR carboxylase family protein [Planctomycetes bacterium]|nr:AIR carboxylase family protein [Planctomycetota bacterium]
MGSQSDWETMRHCADTLAELGIAHEVRIISAHRTPDRMTAYCANLRERGVKVIIAAAGGGILSTVAHTRAATEAALVTTKS